MTIPLRRPVADTPAHGPRGRTAAIGCLALYIAVQGYTIPLVAFGPSWATWPTLPDIASALLVAAAIVVPRDRHRSRIAGQIGCGLVAAVIVCTASYLILTSDVFGQDNVLGGAAEAVGLFQLYRLVQFALIFWAARRISVQDNEWRWIRYAAGGGFGIACLSIVATATGAVPLSAVTAHLPSELNVAGPWAFYRMVKSPLGWGFLGYNHAYGATQVMILGALFMSSFLAPRPELFAAVMVAMIGITFLTESRAGFAGAVLLCTLGAMTLNSPRLRAALAIALLAGVGGALALQWGESVDLQRIIDRQATLLESHRAENLSGRDDIWAAGVSRFASNPPAYVLGIGFGGMASYGNNAHSQVLQVLFETGFVGLGVFAVTGYLVMLGLWQAPVQFRPYLWLTVALAVTSATQETFYPVPATLHSLGLFLAGVAIVVTARKCRDVDGLDETGPDGPISSVHGAGLGTARRRWSSGARSGSRAKGVTR